MQALLARFADSEWSYRKPTAAEAQGGKWWRRVAVVEGQLSARWLAELGCGAAGSGCSAPPTLTSA